MNDKIELLYKLIRENNNIVFFGGAGVSTQSGIPDFRGANGLYNMHPEEIVSHTFFLMHHQDFYKFYWNNMVYLQAKPNECHNFLAYLEKLGKLKCIITQNIDDLHQKAGSKNIIQLHGTINSYHCMKCNKKYNLESVYGNNDPRCSCGGLIKPDVVLYEENLNENDLINSINAIKKADILIVGGTSLNVYPAAGLINYFQGKHLVLINKTKTPYDKYADVVIYDNIAEVLNIKNYLG